jgi:threonine aldolase
MIEEYVMDYVDLRSDTVTQPTPAMRQAMAQAKVGDDVYGEDPTINRLQEMSAEMLGKDAALFIPSGTMGNLVAILAHCNRGDEIILGNFSHIFLHTAGGTAALGGVHSYTIPNQADGTLPLDDIRAAIRPDDAHMPITRLVALENTHNRCGGAALSIEYTQAVGSLAREHDLILHLDGARIFNAAAALGVSAADLAAPADSVMFCLSKGLCAPVGSVLCGDKEFIAKAHRMRKQLGGGMRQAGILAAAGIVGLETIVPHLSQDHAQAQNLAKGLATIPGISLYPDTPQTNLVYLSLDERIPLDARAVAARLAEQRVRVGVVGKRSYRLVVHYWIDDEAVATAVAAFREVISSLT